MVVVEIQIVGKEGARIKTADGNRMDFNLSDSKSVKETNYGEFDPGSG